VKKVTGDRHPQTTVREPYRRPEVRSKDVDDLVMAAARIVGGAHFDTGTEEVFTITPEQYGDLARALKPFEPEQ
jgi:hypothetical protein